MARRNVVRAEVLSYQIESIIRIEREFQLEIKRAGTKNLR